MAGLLKESMRIKIYMEGTVNGYHFKCEGEGDGNPFEGTQNMRIRVTEGAPLPFAFDILSPCCAYGSKTFIKHTSGIPDYFKRSFPEGFTWEGTTIYEDGRVLTAHQDTSLEGNCPIYKVKVLGTNFPAASPVMKKVSGGWEPSTEIVYQDNGVLRGRNVMALKVSGRPPLICHLHSTYRSKKACALTMPGFHFADLRIQMPKKKKDEYFELYEASVARYSDVPEKAT
uniref:Green fluorescent protein-like protein n=1 Tax=Condylactis gigantea TaxID=47073 RepID=Q8MU45_CONGI|nr:green fluorescent protein-like protein [Condylactis gigantea]